MRKLRLKEVQRLAQDHAFNKRWRGTSDLSQIQIARHLSLTTTHTDVLLRCKTVEMTNMGKKMKISLLYGPPSLLKFCWPYFPEAKNVRLHLFVRETIFKEHVRCLWDVVSDRPRCFSLLRSLSLCGFLLLLEYTCPSSLQASANAKRLCGMATAFPPSLSYPSRPTSNVTSVRIFTIIPRQKMASVLPPQPQVLTIISAPLSGTLP